MASFSGWNEPRWILLFSLPAGGVSQSSCVFPAPCHRHGDRTGTGELKIRHLAITKRSSQHIKLEGQA